MRSPDPRGAQGRSWPRSRARSHTPGALLLNQMVPKPDWVLGALPYAWGQMAPALGTADKTQWTRSTHSACTITPGC